MNFPRLMPIPTLARDELTALMDTLGHEKGMEHRWSLIDPLAGKVKPTKEWPFVRLEHQPVKPNVTKFRKKDGQG